MELRQLKYFLAVADARSFVSAAEKQYVSRQAISKSIGLLEEELNVELFMRDSGGAFLTPAGIMFYERVRTLVMELDSVKTQMQSYGTRYQQRIRLAFAIGTLQLLEERLLRYRDGQHNADITYEECPEERCKERLLEHQADVAITTGEIRDPLFVSEELIRSPFGILIKEKEELQDVTVKDLAWIPLAGQSDSQTARFCQQNGVQLQYRGYDCRRLFELVARGKCAMVIPKCLVPADLPGMRWLPISHGGHWQLFGVYPRNAEKNLLYSAAMEDLRQKVLGPITNKGEL